MPWNGSGTYNRNNGTYSGSSIWQSEAADGTATISSSNHDTHDQDLADAINACLAKNGENAMTGNLDLGTNNLINGVNGTFSGTVTANGFSGSGASITDIDASVIDLTDNYTWTGVHQFPGGITGGLSVTGTVTATAFSGDGSALTGVTIPNNAVTNADNNFSTNQTVTGTVTATAFVGDGSALTGLGSAVVNTADNYAWTGTHSFTQPITTTSTVDGRDLSADGAKLDGIASNANNYTHPSYTARTESADTGPLTGATVISDLDFNISVDSSGHVTACDITTVNTRDLTPSDIGAQASGEYPTRNVIQNGSTQTIQGSAGTGENITEVNRWGSGATTYTLDESTFNADDIVIIRSLNSTRTGDITVTTDSGVIYAPDGVGAASHTIPELTAMTATFHKVDGTNWYVSVG